MSTKELINSNLFNLKDKYLLLDTIHNTIQLVRLTQFKELDYYALAADVDEFDRYWYVVRVKDMKTDLIQYQVFDSVTYTQQIIGTPTKAYLIYNSHMYLIKYDVRDAYKLIRTLGMLDITQEQFLLFNNTLKQINNNIKQL